MSAKIQIRHRYTDVVLFECDAPDVLDSGLHMRHALEKATGARADLRDADLRGASFDEGVTAEQGVLHLLGLRWDVIIFDAHMRIGCEMHPLSDWVSFDDRRIAEMDGAHALRFWRQHKSALLTLAQRGNAPAAIAKAKGGAA